MFLSIENPFYQNEYQFQICVHYYWFEIQIASIWIMQIHLLSENNLTFFLRWMESDNSWWIKLFGLLKKKIIPLWICLICSQLRKNAICFTY